MSYPGTYNQDPSDSPSEVFRLTPDSGALYGTILPSAESEAHVQDHGRRTAVVRASAAWSVLILGAFAIFGASSSSSGTEPASLAVDSSVGKIVKDDNPDLVHAFGKWTFASSSEKNAIESTEAMWLAFNQYILGRYMDSWPNYQLIGPTSCENVQRKWSAMRYQAGDNNLHWVHDNSRTVPENGNITVKEMNDMIVETNGDLHEPTQFMDQRYTMATYEIEPYMHMAVKLHEKHGWPLKFYKTNGDDGMTAWVVMTGNKDGQIFETVSVNGPSTAVLEAQFTYESCNYIPTKGLNVTRESCASQYDDDHFTSSQVAGCAFFEYYGEEMDVSKLGKFISAEKFPIHEELPMTIPYITHVMSTDPDTDAQFVLKYFGQDEDVQRTEEIEEREVRALAAAGETFESCVKSSSWVKLSTHDNSSPATYLHMAYHKNYKKGTLRGSEFGTSEYQSYMAKIRSKMQENVYDVFMDNHIGMETISTYFSSIAKKMYDEGVQILTRREPVPGEDGVGNYWHLHMEKFSVFFSLPVSYQVVQLTVIDTTMKGLIESGMPEFCDWDFCPEFYNWRAEPESRTRHGKLTKSTSCGFSSKTGGLK